MSIISEQIPILRERLLTALDPHWQPVSDILLQPVQGEGKMIRPCLAMMANNLFAPPSEAALDVAVAVECIHTASLVHDDIIDQSSLRRGQPSSVSLFGPKAAVLIGDHYFATAFRLLAQHQLNQILQDLAGVVSEMCFGEITQDLGLYNPYISEDEYFANIYGKTASLFAGACRAGAMVANASAHEVQLLGQVGLHLGYAYQLADDIIDYTAHSEDLGKPTGNDLGNGIITLPVIRALKVAPEREWLTRMIASREISALDMETAITIINNCGAFEYTRAAITEHENQAVNLLQTFGPSPAYEQFRSMITRLYASEALITPPDSVIYSLDPRVI